MQPSSAQLTFVRALFGLVGLLLLLAGLSGIALALLDPQLVRDRLPNLAIDAAAVGGAMLALGSVVVIIGSTQLAVERGLRHGAGWSLNAGIGLAIGMVALCLAAAAAALVAAAAGQPMLIGLGVGLIAMAAAYGAAGVVLIGQKLASAGR